MHYTAKSKNNPSSNNNNKHNNKRDETITKHKGSEGNGMQVEAAAKGWTGEQMNGWGA